MLIFSTLNSKYHVSVQQFSAQKGCSGQQHTYSTKLILMMISRNFCSVRTSRAVFQFWFSFGTHSVSHKICFTHIHRYTYTRKFDQISYVYIQTKISFQTLMIRNHLSILLWKMTQYSELCNSTLVIGCADPYIANHQLCQVCHAFKQAARTSDYTFSRS